MTGSRAPKDTKGSPWRHFLHATPRGPAHRKVGKEKQETSHNQGGGKWALHGFGVVVGGESGAG